MPRCKTCSKKQCICNYNRFIAKAKKKGLEWLCEIFNDSAEPVPDSKDFKLLQTVSELLDDNNYRIIDMSEIKIECSCTCAIPILCLGIGRKGRTELVCKKCAKRCSVCDKPVSNDKFYGEAMYEGVCYNCI